MKIKFLQQACLLSGLFLIFSWGITAQAASHSAVGNGQVTVEDSGISPPVDPEKPHEEVDPSESPSTTGELRIDFVSQLRFGRHKISDDRRQYDSLAQLFHSDTGPRDYYVQVTDRREKMTGWELQVSQNDQFSSKDPETGETRQLDGAALSFDNGWANSLGAGANSPQVAVPSTTILMNEITAAYAVALASANQGSGIWTIEFGASSDNQQGQKNTLSPLLNEDGSAVIDELFNKPAYGNSAVKLVVPNSTEIYPVEYSTALTWMLISGPVE